LLKTVSVLDEVMRCSMGPCLAWGLAAPMAPELGYVRVSSSQPRMISGYWGFVPVRVDDAVAIDPVFVRVGPDLLQGR
jgi:hypothetical protein